MFSILAKPVKLFLSALGFNNQEIYEKTEEQWEIWQQQFGDSVFRIDINKVLEYDERHMYELIAFLDTNVNPDWRRLIKDYREHINV